MSSAREGVMLRLFPVPAVSGDRAAQDHQSSPVDVEIAHNAGRTAAGGSWNEEQLIGRYPVPAILRRGHMSSDMRHLDGQEIQTAASHEAHLWDRGPNTGIPWRPAGGGASPGEDAFPVEWQLSPGENRSP